LLESILADQFAVKYIPVLHRLRRSQHVRKTHVYDMETAAEQSEIGIGFVPKKFSMPGPGPARSFVFRRNHEHRFAIDLEIETLEPKPERASARELGRRMRCGFDRQQFDLPYVHNRARLLALRL